MIMRNFVVPKSARRGAMANSFTLIEMLTVMAIIAILAALILAAGNGVMIKAERSRASAEIQAMGTALESYKTDNGIYPQTSISGFATNQYPSVGSTNAAGVYQQSSQLLYLSLSGQTNFLDTPVAGNKSYMAFKANQLGNATTAAGTGASAATSTYVKDPFGGSYGYSTGYANGTTTNYPYNGNGFFDLWSTAGPNYLANQSLTNAWLSNWQ